MFLQPGSKKNHHPAMKIEEATAQTRRSAKVLDSEPFCHLDDHLDDNGPTAGAPKGYTKLI